MSTAEMAKDLLGGPPLHQPVLEIREEALHVGEAVDAGEAACRQGLEQESTAQPLEEYVRRIGDETWRDCAAGGIDPRIPYRLFLPSGREIDLFFAAGELF